MQENESIDSIRHKLSSWYYNAYSRQQKACTCRRNNETRSA